jgi:hypothetical protein
MNISYTYQCNDYLLNTIRVDLVLDTNNQVTSARLFKKKSNNQNWEPHPIQSITIDNQNTLIISFDSQYCDSLRLALNNPDTSSIRIKNKWLKLTRYQPQSLDEEKTTNQVTLKLPSIKPSIQKQSQLPSLEKTKTHGIMYKGKFLNTESKFDEVSQYLAEKYYLQPYKDAPVSNGIKRHYHGATHAACATYTAENGGLFIELLKKYLPNDYGKIIRELNDNNDLTQEDFLLIKYAIFCHDTANTSDGPVTDEKAHADIFTKEMLGLGFKPEKINRFAYAIANKDAAGTKNILQMLVHDADCWEINRILSSISQFNIEELDIAKLLTNKINDDTQKNKILTDLERISNQYFSLMRYIYDSKKHHERCEHSPNVYREVEILIHQFSYTLKISKFGEIASTNVSPNSKIYIMTPLTLYHPETIDATSMQGIKKALFTKSQSNQPDDTVLKKYQSTGLYIRSPNDFDAETEILKKNAEIMKSHGIKNSQQLKAYFTNDEKSGDAKLLPDFYFRPATLIIDGLAIKPILSDRVTLLINPTSPSVFSTHFYKNNVNSYSTSKQYFFKRPFNGAKDKESLSGISNKLVEREYRRRGEAWDNYNRHFGNNIIAHNELFMTYSLDAIVGLVANPSQAQESVKFYFQYLNATGKALPFYYYDMNVGQLYQLEIDNLITWCFNADNENTDHRLLLSHLKSSNILYPDLDDAYSKFNLDSLLTIQCSLEDKSAPHQKHPIHYPFIYKNSANKKLHGGAYMQNGFPVIELEGKRYFDANGYMQSIIAQYTREQIQASNLLLKNKNILQALGVNTISIDMVRDDKLSLVLTYQTINQNVKTQDILQKIGYSPTQLKWKVISEAALPDVQIRLSVLQALSGIHQTLKTYTTKPEHAPKDIPSKTSMAR